MNVLSLFAHFKLNNNTKNVSSLPIPEGNKQLLSTSLMSIGVPCRASTTQEDVQLLPVNKNDVMKAASDQKLSKCIFAQFQVSVSTWKAIEVFSFCFEALP